MSKNALQHAINPSVRAVRNETENEVQNGGANRQASANKCTPVFIATVSENAAKMAIRLMFFRIACSNVL